MSIKENGQIRVPKDRNLVPLGVPGMYTLPDHLLQKDFTLSKRYRRFCEEMKSRRSIKEHIIWMWKNG